MKNTYKYISLFVIGLTIVLGACQKNRDNLNPVPSITTTGQHYYGVGKDSSITVDGSNPMRPADIIIARCKINTSAGIKQIDAQTIGNAKIEILRDSLSFLVVDKSYYQQRSWIPVKQKIGNFKSVNNDELVFRISNITGEANVSLLIHDSNNLQSNASYTFVAK